MHYVPRRPSPLIDQHLLHDTQKILRHKFPTVLRLFLDDTRQSLDTIAGMLEAMPSALDHDLKLTVHSIRSASAQFGATRLAQTAQRLERLVTRRSKMARPPVLLNSDRLANAYAALLRHYSMTEEILRPLCGSDTAWDDQILPKPKK